MIDPLLLPLANTENATYGTASVPTWQNASGTCRVHLTIVNYTHTFAFEGTTDFAEWLQDFNPLEIPDKFDPQIGPIHLPTLNNVREVLPFITACLDGLGKPPCYIVGHSKGSREGPVCHALLKSLGYAVSAGYYFEPPRTGGPMLRDYLANESIVMTQTFNNHGSDIVTLVPDGPQWVHIRPLIRLQVPDSFSIGNKHRMIGVITGINALQSVAA
jgi:hypothetical protein